MKCRVVNAFALIVFVALASAIAFGQVTSSLSGTVTDPNGAVVSGASVIIKNDATGAEFKATTSGSGTYTVPSLGTGTYTMAVTAPGFKQSQVREVKIDAGIPANVNVTLEVGAASESVVIQGGAEMLQSQSANIATTLNVKQIINLPLVSRNALNFIVFMPGVDTPGQNRDSTINGLPQNAINITLDGVNVNDNFNKTGDGFFARVSPRLDAIEEVTVSTATPSADNGGGGATQIKFVTRQGTNELHGSLYEYHRNPVLNSNYWFSNRDGAPFNVQAGKVCGDPNSSTFDPNTMVAFDRDKCKAQRARVLTNQFGFRVGGPIWLPKIFDGRNKAFFFVNYEEFRLPNASNEQRTIFNSRTQAGWFRWVGCADSDIVNGVCRSGAPRITREVNLLEMAQRNGQTATIDPTIGKLLADIRGTTSKGNVTPLTDPNLERFNFTTPGNNITYFPTVRFDVNLTDKHRLELTWNYQKLYSTPDFLNNRDEAFPGFPNRGSQIGDRYTGSMAVRSTLSQTVVNEARAGLSGGPSRFNPEASAVTFSDTLANQGGFNLAISAAGISNATSTPNASRRNPLLKDFSDTLTWTRGSHNLSFGGQFTQLNLTLHSRPGLVPGIGFGVNANDPAAPMFNAANAATNFPGSADADRTRAANIYAVLTGRVTSITANALLNEETGKYEYLGESINRGRQREYSIFAQDSWRAHPNLTLNFGLRWVVQGPFTALNEGYTTVKMEDLFGVSGQGNLFKPGTLTGRVTQFVPFRNGDQAYNVDYSNFAPNFGVAWTPNVKYGWLKPLLGEGGQTVIRAGYSVAYNRNGLGDFSGVFGSNPGSTINADRSLAIGNLAAINELPVLFRDGSRLGRPSFAETPNYPLTEVITGDANIFDPNIKVPYSQSWSFGIQREITKDMAVEVRYVGTRNLQGWTEYDLNDVQQNILENGTLEEFKLAQANLQANNAAGGARAGSFGYFGPGTGTFPLPITLAHFTGNPASAAGNVALYSNASNSLFRNSTFVNPLAMFNPAPLTYAAALHSDANRRTNAARAGLPANLFLTNPDLRGGVFFTGNGGYTRYDALQVEFRRRMAKGFLVQSNYSFAKGFASTRFGSFRSPRTNTLNNGVPGYIAHAFKVNWLYELPIGRGKALFGNIGGALDRLVGGWEFHGAARIQSGQILNFGNVRLVGMTEKEFRNAYGLYFDDANKIVYNLPKDIIDNTIKAFSTSATSTTGYGSLGPPTGRYLAPANSPSCLQVVTGDCAPQTLYVTGPMFSRFDLSAVKRFRISERFNFELRGEFLNAFNNINFLGVTGASNSQTLGQITAAYTDSSNTQDPGGRLIQIVARFNF